MNPRLNVIQIILRSFIHNRTNYSSFFYPLPSLKIGGELSGANCPGGELSDIRCSRTTFILKVAEIQVLKKWNSSLLFRQANFACSAEVLVYFFYLVERLLALGPCPFIEQVRMKSYSTTYIPG